MTETTIQSDDGLGVASTEAIRAAFPALLREIDGHPAAYFDGPGGTQVPEVVADAVRSYLLEHNANSGWNYPTSHETDEIVDAGRRAMADLVGGSPDEIAFGPNMTTLTLRVSRALGRALGPGDRVVVTELDHHANVDPWKALEAERGAEIRTVRMDAETGRLDMGDLEDAIDDRTRILAIGAASNALGTLTNVTTAAGLAHAVGATVFVDAVHYAPHELVDAHLLGADLLAISPYKFYGPHLGVLWGRREIIEELPLPRVASAPNYAPDRIETGTASFEAIAGATAAVEFLSGLADQNPDAAGPAAAGPAAAGSHDNGGITRRARLTATYAALRARGDVLFRRLWTGIADLSRVRMFGPSPGAGRTPTLGFTIEDVRPDEAAGAMARKGLFLSHGDFYATTVIERLGYRGPGILRAGCVAYTTEREVDRLVEAIAALARH